MCSPSVHAARNNHCCSAREKSMLYKAKVKKNVCSRIALKKLCTLIWIYNGQNVFISDVVECSQIDNFYKKIAYNFKKNNNIITKHCLAKILAPLKHSDIFCNFKIVKVILFYQDFMWWTNTEKCMITTCKESIIFQICLKGNPCWSCLQHHLINIL